jgi:PAS domain S-box-containing protein
VTSTLTHDEVSSGSIASAEQVAAVLEASTEDLIVATNPAGVVTVFNRGAERMLGYTAQDVVGRMTPLVWHDQAEVNRRAAELGVAPGFDVLAHAARSGSPETRGWIFVRKDGTRLAAQLTVTPVIGAGSEISGYLGIAHDVTARRQAEDALRRADTRYRALVENAVEGIYQSSPDGRVLTANRAAARLLGYPSPEALIAHVTNSATQIYVDPQDRAALVRQLVGHGTVEGFECRFRRKDGRVIWVAQNARAVFDDGGAPLHFEGTIEDITARKLAEAEHARLEHERDEFFSSISHDLRTPLAAIIASIGVVLANEPASMPPALHRLLVNIDQSADDMARLVEDLLELTRLQAGRIELYREPSDLREIALHAVHEIEPLADGRGQHIHVELPPEPLRGWVDTERLGRVLLNLLGNANKYGQENGAILLRLEELPRGAVFSVVDDGPGIHTRDQARIFERFYRADSEVHHFTKGSGLGLPIARALVELHGGRLWVESAPGRGATFRVALPLEDRGPERESDGST